MSHLEPNSWHLQGVPVCISRSASLENWTPTQIKKARKISVKTWPQWSLTAYSGSGSEPRRPPGSVWQEPEVGEQNRKKHGSCMWGPPALRARGHPACWHKPTTSWLEEWAIRSINGQLCGYRDNTQCSDTTATLQRSEEVGIWARAPMYMHCWVINRKWASSLFPMSQPCLLALARSGSFATVWTCSSEGRSQNGAGRHRAGRGPQGLP